METNFLFLGKYRVAWTPLDCSGRGVWNKEETITDRQLLREGEKERVKEEEAEVIHDDLKSVCIITLLLAKKCFLVSFLKVAVQYSVPTHVLPKVSLYNNFFCLLHCKFFLQQITVLALLLYFIWSQSQLVLMFQTTWGFTLFCGISFKVKAN